MPSQALAFFKRFLREPTQVGAILPSSRGLARRMAGQVPVDGTVLEIGAGTGALTKELVARLASPTQLTSVEMDTDLAQIFRERFPEVELLIEDAETTLDGRTSWDAVVSGVPFAVMESAKRGRMFSLIARMLNPGGAFIAFQYSLSTKAELESIFKNVSVLYVPLNIPPAAVYVCRDPKS